MCHFRCGTRDRGSTEKSPLIEELLSGRDTLAGRSDCGYFISTTKLPHPKNTWYIDYRSRDTPLVTKHLQCPVGPSPRLTSGGKAATLSQEGLLGKPVSP